MAHAIYRVIDFAMVSPYTLRLSFNDGAEQVIDFRPMLEGAVYGSLRDEKPLAQVEIDPEVPMNINVPKIPSLRATNGSVAILSSLS